MLFSARSFRPTPPRSPPAAMIARSGFWDTVLTGQQRGVHLGHAGRIWNLSLSPDGRTIASAGKDGTVKVWNAEGSPEYARLPCTSAGPVGFERSGRTVLILDVSDGWSVGRWDARSGSLMKRTRLDLVGRLHYNDFSNDGRTLVTVDDEGAVHEWDTATGGWQGAVAPGSGKVIWLKISTRMTGIFYPAVGDLTAKYLIWDRENRRLIPVPRNNVRWIVFAASGDPVLVLKNGEFVWWDPSTGHTTVRSLDVRFHNTEPTFSPDGRLVALAEPGTGFIHLLSAQTLELVREMAPQIVEVTSTVFSPDGKTLAVLRADRTVKLLETATGEELICPDGFGKWTIWHGSSSHPTA